MDRLTERTNMGIVGNNESVKNYPLYKVAEYDELDHGITGQCFEKLAEYEDLEEQGLLLRLPCNVGSTLYQPISNRINEYKAIGLCFDITRNEFMYEVAYQIGLEWYKTTCDFNCINKTVFLTKAEAEQKLKEMEVKEYLEELKRYRDLEEQGLLLRLPCKVGTKVYAINRIIDYGEVGDEATYSYSIIEREFQIYMMMEYGELVFGKTVFLTKVEAEQKLKEMESK